MRYKNQMITIFSEQGPSGLEKFLQFMTSLGKLPPLGLRRKIEVEFCGDNAMFFAETCAYVLRVPTVHTVYDDFYAKFLEASENYLGYGAV